MTNEHDFAYESEQHGGIKDDRVMDCLVYPRINRHLPRGVVD